MNDLTNSETSATKRVRKGDGPISNWLLSVGFMIIVPCLPIFIEAVRNEGTIKADTYYITGAVLAASYGIASLHHLFRFGYLCLFVGTLSLDFQPEGSGKLLQGWLPMGLMIAVVFTQAIERFGWHVVQNRRFPDWLEDENVR